MAVFMLNVCKFNSCGLTFKSLGHLIQHIEETHIDYDPRVLERSEQQQPACIPLSYVLRFLAEGSRAPPRAQPPRAECSEEGDDSEQELLSEPSDSNDSWTTLEEFSSDFILRYGSRSSAGASSREEKPFACPVPGCKKRYKNVNGIKYHSKNGHKRDGKVRKAFRCGCGKSYKTPQGLRQHAALRHRMAPEAGPKAPAVPAIQDHGYMKPHQGFEQCEALGVLTPASSPRAAPAADRYLCAAAAAAPDD